MIMAAIFMLLLSSIMTIPSGETAPTRAGPSFVYGGGPNSAYTDTIVNFTAMYMDTDGDAPQYVAIYIGGIRHNMTEITGPNYSYARGAPFFYTAYLSAGNHSYYFFTNNTLGETARYPQANNLTIWMKTRPSTGNPQITYGDHSPSTPDDRTDINFTATYTDTVLGGKPLYMNLVVYDGLRFNYHNMTIIRYGTTELYLGYWNTSLPTGSYPYYFEAHSGKETRIVRYPASGFINLTVKPYSSGDHPPEFTGMMHSPTSPAKGQQIDFQVTYKDKEGDPPASGVYLYYTVNNKDFTSIIKTNMTGTNYTAGVKCTVNHTFDDGIYFYYFVAIQGSHLYWSDTRTLIVGTGINTTSPFLRMGAAIPWEPVNNETVYFNVTYQDPRGTTQPSWVKVYVGKPGAYPTPYTLTYVRGNLTLGATYSTSVRMPAGNYYYYFGAQYSTVDIHYPYNSTLPLYVSGGYSPLFTLSSPNASPGEPRNDETVTFSIVATGPDGHAPGVVRLHIQRGAESVHVHHMAYSSGIIMTGITYTVRINLSEGVYYYVFSASEDGENFTYHPGGGLSFTLVVKSGTVTDKAPKLLYGSHSPVNPTTAENVTFSVTYQDADGDAPLFVNLVIGHPWIDTPTMNTYNMTVTGTNYAAGVIASITLRLVPYVDSRFGYWFMTSSNGSHVKLPSIWYNLTLTPSSPGDHTPVLSRGSYSPSSPTSGTNITFTVVYSDLDDDAPVHVRLLINPIQSSLPYTSYNMTWSGSSFVYGVTATVTIRLSAGNYSYYFQTASGNFTVRLPSSGISTIHVAPSSPPQQDRPPVLTFAAVSPTSPVANQTVTFSVVYSDADGSRPNSVLLHLFWGAGQGYSNFTMTYTPGNYISGVTCSYTTVLAAGTYYYYVAAVSGSLSARAPSSGTYRLDVQSINYNRSNFAAHASFDIGDDGEVDMNVIETEDGVTITFDEGKKGYIKVELSSVSVEDRVIRLDLGSGMFSAEDLEKLEIVLDGRKVDLVPMTDPEKYIGDEPAYFAVTTEDGTILYLFIPDMDTHVLTARVKDEESPGSSGLIWVLGAFLILVVIAALLSLSLLSAAQKRKKVEVYFEDFDTGIRKDPVLSGSIGSDDEEDIDWDDLVE